MIFTRPFKEKILNIFMILLETCVTICYSGSVLLLCSVLNQEVIMWTILSSISFSYFLQSALGYYKIYNILSPVVRAYFRRIARTDRSTANTLFARDR